MDNEEQLNELKEALTLLKRNPAFFAFLEVIMAKKELERAWGRSVSLDELGERLLQAQEIISR